MDDELEMDSVENSLAVDTGAKAEVEVRGSFSNTLGAVPSTPVVPVPAGRGEDRPTSAARFASGGLLHGPPGQDQERAEHVSRS